MQPSLPQNGHTGYYACEWCLAAGTRSINRRSTLYPSTAGVAGNLSFGSAHGCRPREAEDFKRDADLVEQGQLQPPRGSKGILGRSRYQDLNGFNPITGTVLDVMHVLTEGVLKKMLGIAFEVLEGSTGDAEALKGILKRTKSPSEADRRLRDVAFTHWKANELCFFNQHVAPNVFMDEDIIKDSREWQQIFALLTYISRGVTWPSDGAYAAANEEMTWETVFNKLYNLIGGYGNHIACTYNVHVLSEHLNDHR